MPRPLNRIDHALRRSRARAAVLHVAAGRGPLVPGELARLAHVDVRRVRQALLGDGHAYRRDLSLVGLGLMRRAPSSVGMAFEATPRGLEALARLPGTLVA